MSKTKNLGNETFVLPFVATGLWVEDARRKSVGEFRDNSVAKSIASMLNAPEKSSCEGDVDRQSGAFTEEEIRRSTEWR